MCNPTVELCSLMRIRWIHLRMDAVRVIWRMGYRVIRDRREPRNGSMPWRKCSLLRVFKDIFLCPRALHHALTRPIERSEISTELFPLGMLFLMKIHRNLATTTAKTAWFSPEFFEDGLPG